MNANLQFYDGMTLAEEIQEIYPSANDLISIRHLQPSYLVPVARLLSYGINKQVFGEYKPITLREMIDKNIERGVYDPAILEYYNDEEIARMDLIFIAPDENFILRRFRR